jgi:hypothetical protein
VGLIDQLVGDHFTPQIHFCTRVVLKTGPSWCSIPYIAKVNKNEVITFERLKTSLKSCMGPLGLGQRPGKSLRLVSKTNPLWVLFFYGPFFFILNTRSERSCPEQRPRAALKPQAPRSGGPWTPGAPAEVLGPRESRSRGRGREVVVVASGKLQELSL